MTHPEHSLQPYPEYKDSGVAWLGEIPAHWRLQPGFSVFREKQQKNIGMIETTVLSLSYGRIVIKPAEKLHGLVPESFETYQIINPGDIIIRPTDLQNDWTSLRVGIARDRGIITSAYLCLQPNELVLADYGYLLLHAYDLMKIFYGMGSGLRQNLDFTDLKRMPVPVPPLDEQQSIVRFINHIDHRVNRFIRAKRRLITLLNEQKQAIIHQVVTRGLDPNVRLKPSGVEWLGEVPEHWDIVRTKFLFREVDTRSVTGLETHLSMSQKLGLVPSSAIEERRLMSESYIGGKLCETGDLVLNRLKAHLGVFALASQSGIVSPDYTVFRPVREICNQYFEFVLRTPACRVEFRKRAKGIVQGFWRLYTDDFYEIFLPVPDTAEQYKIVEYLTDELHQLNDAIGRIDLEIDLIREYRTRLIANVVTGKLDVRGVVLSHDLPVDDAMLAADELADNDMDLAEELANADD